MRSLVLLPVAAVAVQVLETQQPAHAHVDYDGLKITLKGIAEQTKSGKIDQETTEAVRKILNGVEGDLMNALHVDRNNTQAIYDAAVQAIQDCDDSRDGWFQGAHGLPYYQEATGKARDAHNRCRAEERTKCTTRNTNCDAQDKRVEGIDDQMCKTPNFSNGDSIEVNAFMNCITDLICGKYEDYIAGRTQCRSDCTALGVKTAGCHTLQQEFELATCNELTQIQGKCGAYRECRFREEKSYYETRQTVLSEESLFQAQRVALECLMCYGRAILNEDTDFAKCDSPSPCSSMPDCPIIIYSDYHPPVPWQMCSEVHATKPCEAEWCDIEYTRDAGVTGNFLTGEISRNRCDPATDGCLPCAAARVGEEGDESVETSSGYAATTL